MKSTLYLLLACLFIAACNEPNTVSAVQQVLPSKSNKTASLRNALQEDPKPTARPLPKVTTAPNKKKNASKKKYSRSPSNPDLENELLQDSLDLDDETVQYIPNIIPESEYPHIFRVNYQYISDGFDYPVGKPNAVGYYKSQNFGDRLHLGEDWNGNGGGNTDMGDPVYATGHGLITFAQDVCCGWGNTIRIIHCTPNQETHPYTESVYSHLHTMHVNVGDMVTRGQQIGTIGNAEGRYVAHLHFEMREFINMSLGPGYSDDQMGYLDPTPFIKANRPVR